MLSFLHELDLSTSIGWTLVHSLWQGLVAWTVYVISCRFTDRPAYRYAAGNACLTAFMLVQCLTLGYCVAATLWPELFSGYSRLFGSVEPDLRAGERLIFAPLPDESVWTSIARLVEPYLRLICLLWAAALAVRGCLTAGALVLLEREVRRCQALTDPLLSRARSFCQQLQIRRPVRFLGCDRLAVPATAGWLKPVVLVPLSTFTTLTPAQLEALLLHELAHIARHDYLANFVRSILQGIYFFHPLIRRMVRELGDQAESLTDELAIGLCPSRKLYVEALVTLEEKRSSGRLLLGADGGSLKGRMLNLLAERGVQQRGGQRLSALAPLTTAFLIVLLFGQSVAIATADRIATERPRRESLNQCVLSILSDAARPRASLSNASPSAAGERVLADAILEVRQTRTVRPATLDALATALRAGLPAKTITSLRDVEPDVALIEDLAPHAVDRFGSPAERQVLIRALLDGSTSTATADRRRFARAAVCLAALGEVRNRADYGLLGLLTRASFVDRLGLDPAQRQRLSLAIRADASRRADIFLTLPRLARPGYTPDDAELGAFLDGLRLVRWAQRPAADLFSVDLHTRADRLIRADPGRFPPEELDLFLHLGRRALAAPDQFHPKYFDILDPDTAMDHCSSIRP